MFENILLIPNELQANAMLLIGSTFALGLLIGSFLNVVIYRLPIMLEKKWASEDCSDIALDAFNLSKPRSRCTTCNHSITAIENIPVLSYIFLKGKCSACQDKISPRYPLIEFGTGAVSAFIAWRFGWSALTVTGLILSWSLIALIFIDLDTQLLPDDITLPLLWVGLIFNLCTKAIPLDEAVIGAAIGYLSLWSIYWAFKLITGKEGFGYGDFKLLAALGAWLGWQSLPFILITASAAGAIVGITLIILKKINRAESIPFGPYLSIAGWLYFVY
jgi:leader peptidase (prepilin peptidase)/N-methyltransferase